MPPTDPQRPITAPRNRLLLIDGHAIVRRVYEAVPGEGGKKKAEGALDASWLSILRAIRETNPTHFLAAFDFGGETWRHRLYAKYKADREPMAEALRDAMPAFLERLNNAGLRTLRVPGVEADDTLATLALKAVARGFEVVLAASDKDMLRLINEGVQIRDHFKSEWRDEAYVVNKFGVPSALMVDLLALMGDDTDGIPGVNKIGATIGARLLNEHGSLEGVLEAATSGIAPIKGAVGDNLRANAGIARLSRKLATLKLDVPLGITPNDIRIPPSVTELLEVRASRASKNFLGALKSANVAAQSATVPPGGADDRRRASRP
jgi:5'-3' exonuclease